MTLSGKDSLCWTKTLAKKRFVTVVPEGRLELPQGVNPGGF